MYINLNLPDRGDAAMDAVAERQTEMDAWEKVRAALANPRWDFRTVDGIAKETKLHADQVRQILDSMDSEVRIAEGRNHRVLYTLKSRPVTVREILSSIQRVVQL